MILFNPGGGIAKESGATGEGPAKQQGQSEPSGRHRGCPPRRRRILAAFANMDAAEKHQLLEMVRDIASIEGGGLSYSQLDALERLRRQRA